MGNIFSNNQTKELVCLHMIVDCHIGFIGIRSCCTCTQRIFQPYARILHRSEMESFTALFIAMELIFHCLDRAIVRGKAVSFRGLSLVSRVATSLAVAAGQRLSLSEAVVVYFAASFDCRGEDSLSLADVDDEPATPPAPVPVSVRRSGRVRRAPVWHKDYIM
ncbi:uncharacterized protein [Argopecten irradians]|uniref:uncharacterized protein isoform X2 n=1 Tax=Argopecten irradians TaxID=31199 RepID=UPI00371722DF